MLVDQKPKGRLCTSAEKNLTLPSRRSGQGSTAYTGPCHTLTISAACITDLSSHKISLACNTAHWIAVLLGEKHAVCENFTIAIPHPN